MTFDDDVRSNYIHIVIINDPSQSFKKILILFLVLNLNMYIHQARIVEHHNEILDINSIGKSGVLEGKFKQWFKSKMAIFLKIQESCI